MGNKCFEQKQCYTVHKQVDIKIIKEVEKSICKILITKNENEDKIYGTGFFLNYSDSQKYLITNCHVINPSLDFEKIEINIWNNNKMKLDLNNRFIKSTDEQKDITIIEIKKTDEIYEDIKFLDYDNNYIKGYEIYNDVDIFSIGHPLGEDASCASGKIRNIYSDKPYEFQHDISTDYGSSGSPILLNNNNINFVKVIGIHKSKSTVGNLNKGTFIGEIFKEIKNDLISENTNIDNSNKTENYIKAEIYIKEEDVNKNIRIINSYEEWMRTNKKSDKLEKDYMNEEEIKKCEIKINNDSIPFNYYHKFKSKGKYTIKYLFKDNINKSDLLFGECETITRIDLSNFNTQDVTNMDSMFGKCSSLANINLSNIDTQKVINMDSMFGKCFSLAYIDLTNFNTQNVTNMSAMFAGCSSLKNVDLSNFDTKKVNNMSAMFAGCSSLTNIDLSNFFIQEGTDIRSMFKGCEKLKKENIITKDKRILNEIK